MNVRLNAGQVRALLQDRLDGAGPCQVQEDLPLAALAATTVLPNARILLAEIGEDGAKLTARGNLSRALVGRLVERFQWHDYAAADIRAVCKVVNEHDFPPVMYLHAVSRIAGLVRHGRGSIRLTRKGRALLADGAAGRLHAALFRATFGRYNLAYLDGANMPEIFGPQIALILYLIGRVGGEWQTAGALMRGVVLPTPEVTEPIFPRLPETAFDWRILRYLVWFGLLETRSVADNDEWRQPKLYRVSPLYGRMLRFALAP